MTWMTKQLIVLVVAIAIMAGVAGVMPCVAESAQDTSQSVQKLLASVETITVNGDGDKAELVIKLSAPATYTSYKTTSPLRLIIDLSQTTQGAISSPVELNKGNFKNVVVSRFDTDAGVLTRLDIELVKDADAILSVSQDKPGEIRVSFPSLAAQAAVADTSSISAQSEPVTSATVNTVATPVSERPAVSGSIAESADALSRTLTAVSMKDNSIILAINGGAGEFKTFRLNKPERFVVDLFNVKSALASRITSLNSLGVSSARLGVYPNKVRIVFDTMNGTFPEATAVKSAEGVTISLKGVSSKENTNSRMATAPKIEALPEPIKQNESSAQEVSVSNTVASAPPAVAKPVSRKDVAKTTERSGSASVEMIDFQVIDGISRVAVKVTGNVLVDAPIKTPGFVTLTIKNAVLPKKLQRSLEAKGFVSPVLRVTPLLVKSRKGADTKIRVAMRKSVPFEYRQEGDMLFIDFKNPEGLTADRGYSDALGLRPRTARSAKESSRKDAELGSALTSQAEPAVIKSSSSSKMYKGRKVTLEFADAEVRKIFQLLSEVSNKNFVLGDDVTGSISIKLVNVPWDHALDIILDAKGLDKREDGNIIIIKGKGKFRSQAEEDQELKKAKLRATELETQIFNINYANPDDIVTQFKSMMTEGVGATVNKDTRTNKVIVKDVPQAIRSMRELLKDLDITERQVMIEARIVEASSAFTRSLGVNWGVHYRDASGSLLGITGLDTGFGGMTTAPPTSGTGSEPGGNMGISFGTLASNIQLDLRLSAAATANLIKIVSTPKIATLNNKTAKITQGQQIPYTSSTSDKVETKFIEAALALEVTPHINSNGTISMKIDAKNDSMGEVPSGSTAPAINKKQATTEMLLRDGETTVIGGIFVDSDNDTDEGVPFLMDIPVLGKLFKTSTKIKNKSELLIFITPRILSAI